MSTTTVFSWHQALDRGYHPAHYPFIATLVPQGQVRAVLDFKVWARRGPAICCCFTEIESGRKFQLAVYKQPGDGPYLIAGCAIDFKTCPTGRVYRLWISRNREGNAVLTNAIAC
nr:hypothetical protein [uncultured Dyadobacter sp.]